MFYCLRFDLCFLSHNFTRKVWPKLHRAALPQNKEIILSIISSGFDYSWKYIIPRIRQIQSFLCLFCAQTIYIYFFSYIVPIRCPLLFLSISLQRYLPLYFSFNLCIFHFAEFFAVYRYEEILSFIFNAYLGICRFA